jgi:hypothetical protein
MNSLASSLPFATGRHTFGVAASWYALIISVSSSYSTSASPPYRSITGWANSSASASRWSTRPVEPTWWPMLFPDTTQTNQRSSPSPAQASTVNRLCQAHATDPALVALKEELAAGHRSGSWSLLDGLVAFNGHLYIPPASPLLHELISVVHDDGHEGVQRTLHHLRGDFHFPNLRHAVQDYVCACTTCQRYKSDHLHPIGLLLPLPVPTAVWTDIGLDFVEALPRVGGKFVILTVVDRFSKYCHFIPLAHPYTAESVAQVFFTEIMRLHGVPRSMVLDRDSVFTSIFWRELMRLIGAKLHMTSAFHPQSDGQTKAANKVIVMYLRYFTRDCPRQWLHLLP